MANPPLSLPKRRLPLRNLREYVLTGSNSVEGWLVEGAKFVIWSLIEVQEHLGIRGDIAEIGVYKGRLFILLSLALREGEVAIAVDPFSFPMREANFEAEFRGNLDKFGIAANAVRIHATHSERLASETLLADRPHKVRLFSVDGDHSLKAIANDLPLAAKCLTDDGVMIIDDLFHTWSPQVTEGVIDFLRGNNEIVPLALIDRQGSLRYGGVKLLACRRAYHATYGKWLAKLNRKNSRGTTPFCGHETFIFDFSDGAFKAPLLNGYDEPDNAAKLSSLT